MLHTLCDLDQAGGISTASGASSAEQFYNIMHFGSCSTLFCTISYDIKRTIPHWIVLFVFCDQTTPCAIIASATFRKPAIFAPAT